MNKITILIAEDEDLASDLLIKQLADYPDLQVIGVARHGQEAIERALQERPDVLLLDIQMPGKSGLQVAQEIMQNAVNLPSYVPLMIFITAYDQYALQAFEHQAVDYLLKPFTAERLEKMVQRVRHYSSGSRPQDLSAWLAQYMPSVQTILPANYPEVLSVKDGARIHLVKVPEITHIEAEGNYVRIHTTTSRYIMSATLTHLQSKLNPLQFARIHRSTIVHKSFIKEIRSHFNGDATVILSNQVNLRLSRNYKQFLKLE